jgi:cysteinyl-tRNA synthetase
MKLYNTLTRSVDEFTPASAPMVTIYTCGPTVYDYPHIGNWFTYIREDILIRTLRNSDLRPNWVMNITDVGHLTSDADDGEDKLQKGARREGKTAWEIAKFYTDYFMMGLKLLNVSVPDHIMKATDHIAEQIALISILEAKGYTYIINDGVYYDTAKFKRYADFARLDLDEQQPGARVEYNPEKRQPTDFALWKFSPKGQARDMEWASPWGKGFPGWHIECSAMSMKYLGETLDIHAGGIDHIPVHHTNEIAQSEAATGKPFARFWLHANHITIKDQKISKSLQNGITLEEIIEQGYSLEAFRLLVLESHYRSQSRFSWESLGAAENRLRELRAMAVLRYQTIPIGHDSPTFTYESAASELLILLQDDLNTPAALSYLSTVSTQVLAILVRESSLKYFCELLGTIDALLGTKLLAEADITSEERELIEKREAARVVKDYDLADNYRHQLEATGILLRDTTTTVIWYRR